MAKFILVLAFALFTGARLGADVLIVADEFPAMRLLADKLKAAEQISSRIVAQTNLPADLSPFSAVIVYIHGRLYEHAEQAFIAYTKAGGKLIALHHSISSGKRKNKDWFKFLGVDLPPGDVSAGGYKWIEPVTLEVVKLAPEHFITTNQVDYPTRIEFADSATQAAAQPMPGFVLKESEVYLNHRLTEKPQLLLGFKYTDPKSGQVWMQSHAGWLRPSGQGLIIYLKPGHSSLDFEDPAYARIVINAVIFKSPPKLRVLKSI